MPVVDELLEASTRFAESFDEGDLPMPPARHVAIVATGKLETVVGTDG